jgi:alanine dehydrogenase
MRTLLLTKEEVRSLVTMKEVIGAVEEAYRSFSAGQVIQPGYMGIHLPSPRGEIDFKAGYSSSLESISLKASSGGFGVNPKAHGLPTGMGTILLFDARSCALVCIMDGSLVTGLRTGAAGAVSVKALARRDARRITSIGNGNQARMQLRAIRELHPIDVVHAWDEFPEASARFKADMETELGIPVQVAASKREAVEQAEILITTTRGQGSLVEAGWVKPGTHIIAIGTDQRGKQELDPEVFRGARIFNDSIEQCVQKGETWHPLDQGIITREDLQGEIGEVLLGQKPGRRGDGEITIFDATGMAIQDNTTAHLVYRNAVKGGVGTWFAFFE